MSRAETNKNAEFFDPFITPTLAVGGTLYGIYNRKKAADQQTEVVEAQKLAALDGIKDSGLRRALISQARGEVIDDYTKNRMVNAAVDGDFRSLAKIGLKKINWDNL